jgi:hypothetical protein
MGKDTWTFLESSIKNASETATCVEDYLQNLCNRLIANPRPQVLATVLEPTDVILRARRDSSGVITELIEKPSSERVGWMGWRDLIERLEAQGWAEYQLLDLLRTHATVIAILVRLRFEEDKASGSANQMEEVIDV